MRHRRKTNNPSLKLMFKRRAVMVMDSGYPDYHSIKPQRRLTLASIRLRLQLKSGQ